MCVLVVCDFCFALVLWFCFLLVIWSFLLLAVFGVLLVLLMCCSLWFAMRYLGAIWLFGFVGFPCACAFCFPSSVV